MSETLPAVKAEIVANSDGILIARNIDEAYRLANAYVKSGLLPVRYTTPEMVLTAMQFGLELGLKPLTALRQIAVIKGTPAAFGDLPLSLCYAKGKLERIKEFLVDDHFNEISFANKNLNAKVFGAVCIVKRIGDPDPLETFFTMDNAKQAGLLGSDKAVPWNQYPQIMLKYRARSMALKSKFPDCLNGISIAEYDSNELPEMENVTPGGARPAPQARQGAQAAAAASAAESLAERMARMEVVDAQYEER
jgi:hypothetical protein